MAAANTKKSLAEQHKKCRLPGPMSSPPSSRRYHGGSVLYRRNETSPPRIMLLTNVHPVFPALLSVSHPHIHSLQGLPYCRSYPVSSGIHARNIRCVYSVFVTPILAPQCLHLIMKSGYRPIAGAVNCIFISVSASMIFRPHFGQRTGRQLIFISCPCSSFFLCIHIRSFLAAKLLSGVYMTCHESVRLHDKP